MGAFLLSKWYMDCVSDSGEVVIAYAARLRWRAVTLHYTNLLVRAPGKEPRGETSMRAAAEPEIAGEVLSWSSPVLGVGGRWSSLAPAVQATIFESADGKVEWRCLQPRARAEITLADRVVQGLGYAEHLELTVEPWRMPIDELRWGRFVGQRSALVWIDWSGDHDKQLVLLDGTEVGRASIDERAVVSERGGVRLAIEEGGSLRRGAIGATALARVPGLDRFPARILAVDEHKWCSRATLDDAKGRDEGWVIHEVVRWPARRGKAVAGGASERDAREDQGSSAPELAVDANAARRAEQPEKHVAGKILYALLFVAALPALLLLWARSAEPVLANVHAQAWHSPTAGLAVAGAGALLMVAGWIALWRLGGGLPMNAFPPPRLVTRSVYAVVAHPIYVGFGAVCFGASIAAGSASGLWLVSPAVALGAVALVLGYERQDLEKRFGKGPAPWLALPPAADDAPSLARRLSALIVAFGPWLALAALRPAFGVKDAAVFALPVIATAAARTQRELRALVVRSLLAMPLVMPLPALLPVTPSLLGIVALLAADAWRAPSMRWLARALALAVATLDLAPPRPGAAGVVASVVAYAAVANAGLLWRGLRALAEWIANSWHETRLGPVRIINHGVWAGLATFGGVAIVASLLGPRHVGAIVVAASAGLVGAGIWAQTIEGSAALSRPYGFYGGLLGICLAALAGPLFGTPIWLLLGGYAVAGPYVQAMGRVRCLVQGCCHGSETTPEIGIRYRHPRSRVCRLAHLEGVPLHATQLYSILWNGVTMVVVARLWSLHAAIHLVGGVYLLLNGLGRFVEEAYRGEPQTPIIARLRLYQWIAIGQVVAGALITALGRSGPAPAPEPNVAGVVAAAIFSVVTWFALGVDFPESNRRFSRLA